MHRELRSLLHEAEGASRFVVAVNVDIRGFSSFFADSSQSAAYLGSAYSRILDEYFNDLSYFKPTGDGLLIVIDVNREALQSVVQTTVASALRLDADFADICAADPLINFATPDRVGIGIARGTATQLQAGGKTLDYSGRPLNLASRLMDLARPHGVVFDGSLGVDLLTDEQRGLFNSKTVYIKGIAGTTPLTAYITDSVIVSEANLNPIGGQLFREKPVRTSLAEIKKSPHRFLHRLSQRPLDLNSLQVGMSFPSATKSGAKDRKALTSVQKIERVTFEDHFRGPHVSLDYPFLADFLTSLGVRDGWAVELHISYVAPLEAPGTSAGTSETPAEADATPKGQPPGPGLT